MPWTLDRSRSRLGFSVKHMMVSTTQGYFPDYEVDLDVDAQRLEGSRVHARISTARVQSGERLRDEYLVGNGFFKSAEFPHMVFESTSVALRGKKITVGGRFTIRGRERPLTLRGTFKESGGTPRRLSFSLAGEIDRDDFGLVFFGAVESVAVVVGKKVKLDVVVELTEA